ASAATIPRAGNPFALTRRTATFAFLPWFAFFHFAACAPLHSSIGTFIQNRRIEICSGFLDKLVTELIPQDTPLDFAHRAFFKIAELERAERNADKPTDRKPQGTENVLYFAVLAFAQSDGNPDIGALNAFKFSFHAAIEHAIHGNAVLQIIQLLLSDLAVSTHAIAAKPSGGRQLKDTRQPAIIGQQQKPLGIDIEPPNRQHARHFRRQRLKDRWATFRITICRHEPGWLMIKPE